MLFKNIGIRYIFTIIFENKRFAVENLANLTLSKEDKKIF
jgi:hypothetical protein